MPCTCFQKHEDGSKLSEITKFLLPMDDGHGFYLQGSTLYLQYAVCIVLLINTAGRIDLPHDCTVVVHW